MVGGKWGKIGEGKWEMGEMGGRIDGKWGNRVKE